MKSIGLKLTAIVLAVILLGIGITLGIAVAISGNTITNEVKAKIDKSTQLEGAKLDKWLSDQAANANALTDVLSERDDLAKILTADQTGSGKSLEDQAADILRPTLKAILDGNDMWFEIYMGFSDGSAVTGSGYQFDYAGGWVSYQRGWYELALTDTAQAHITSPYVDAQTGKLCITVTRAILNNGKLIGVVGVDIFVTELQNIVQNAMKDSDGYAILVDTNGDILIHPDEAYAQDAEGNFQNLGEIKGKAYASLLDKITSKDGIYEYTDASGTVKYYNSSTLSTTGWHIVGVLPVSVVTQHTSNLIWISIPVALGIMVLTALVIFILIRNMVSTPLVPFTRFMQKANATGDLVICPEDIAVINQYSKVEDEIGQCIKAAAGFIGRITEIGKTIEVLADGDLTAELPLLSDIDTVGIPLQKLTSNLNVMFGEISDSTKQVSTGAKQMADGAQALAIGSTEQTTAVEQLSASISAVAQKTKANADMADKAASLADMIKQNAQKGSRQMDEMTSAVKDINQASQNISKVIKVIDDIAFQTNILALNAAVEAARAGQHGKGFAVVAEEVRNLAAKSAEAAKNTGVLISSSIEKAELGARIAHETAASLAEIVTGINESDRIVSEIASSSGQQSEEIADINVGIDKVAQVVQQNSATAQESAAASEEISSQSSVLEDLIAQFKLKDSGMERRLPSDSKSMQKRPDVTAAEIDDGFGKY